MSDGAAVLCGEMRNVFPELHIRTVVHTLSRGPKDEGKEHTFPQGKCRHQGYIGKNMLETVSFFSQKSRKKQFLVHFFAAKARKGRLRDSMVGRFSKKERRGRMGSRNGEEC